MKLSSSGELRLENLEILPDALHAVLGRLPLQVTHAGIETVTLSVPILSTSKPISVDIRGLCVMLAPLDPSCASEHEEGLLRGSEANQKAALQPATSKEVGEAAALRALLRRSDLRINVQDVHVRVECAPEGSAQGAGVRRHRCRTPFPSLRPAHTRTPSDAIIIIIINTHFGRIIFGRRMIETLEGKGRHESSACNGDRCHTTMTPSSL